MNIDAKNISHGIKPNYSARNIIENELKNKDAVMGFTLELIKKDNVNK